jgi:HAD superfamily hydrolase (TIGR01509 family)
MPRALPHVPLLQDVVKPKPAPDIYLAAARVYGLQPSQLLVIEDSPKGKRAAVLAGGAAA